MSNITRRKHERLSFRAPITHSMYSHKKFPKNTMAIGHKGKMGNISAGGLFFESDTPCWGNGPIYINFFGKSKLLLLSRTTDDIPGTVVWCREISGGDARFMVGVKFDRKQAIKTRSANELGAVRLS